MKDALERAFAQQAAAEQIKATAMTKAQVKAKTPAPRKAATATPAARHWGLPDPGHEYRLPAPAAPQTKKSGLDKNMVALLAKSTTRDHR